MLRFYARFMLSMFLARYFFPGLTLIHVRLTVSVAHEVFFPGVTLVFKVTLVPKVYVRLTIHRCPSTMYVRDIFPKIFNGTVFQRGYFLSPRYPGMTLLLFFLLYFVPPRYPGM